MNLDKLSSPQLWHLIWLLTFLVLMVLMGLWFCAWVMCRIGRKSQGISSCHANLFLMISHTYSLKNILVDIYLYNLLQIMLALAKVSTYIADPP